MGEAERRLEELGQWREEDPKERLEQLNERLAVEDAYYQAAEDERARERYYRRLPLEGDGLMLFVRYHELAARTHKRRLPYFFSKDEYLYTWVDLQPDGTVRSLYSGERKDPKTLIVQDVETMKRRYDEFRQLLKKAKQGPGEVHERVNTIEQQWKFNAEHVVPQSWFGAREPMKGDLHHLFVCQPECNTMRSNFPYADFPFYNPEDPDEQIQNHCGVVHNGYFEPEYGKGTAQGRCCTFCFATRRQSRSRFGAKSIFRSLSVGTNNFRRQCMSIIATARFFSSKATAIRSLISRN